MSRVCLVTAFVALSVLCCDIARESTRVGAQGIADTEASASGRFEVVVIAQHALLASEQRLARRIVSALTHRGLPAALSSPGDREPSIRAYMSEPSTAERAARVSPSLLGRASGALFVRMAPPDGRISQGIDGFAVVLARPDRELVWSEGGKLPEDAVPLIAEMVREAR